MIGLGLFRKVVIADAVAPHVNRAFSGNIAHAREAGGVWNDEAVVVRMCHWMERDQKVPPLKTLQGMIWEAGFRNRDFTGHVYADAVRHLKDWHARGITLYVFSSGSVQAQRLLFGHSDAGDLTPLFSGFYDTRIGAKREAASYRAIVEAVGRGQLQQLAFKCPSCVRYSEPPVEDGPADDRMARGADRLVLAAGVFSSTATITVPRTPFVLFGEHSE